MIAAGISTQCDLSSLPECLQPTSAERQQSYGGSVGIEPTPARLQADSIGAVAAKAAAQGRAGAGMGPQAGSRRTAAQSQKERVKACKAKQKLSLRKIVGKRMQ